MFVFGGVSPVLSNYTYLQLDNHGAFKNLLGSRICHPTDLLGPLLLYNWYGCNDNMPALLGLATHASTNHNNAYKVGPY